MCYDGINFSERMSMIEYYFVTVWKDGEEDHHLKFDGVDDLFAWVQDNKDADFCIYRSNCLLDWS